MPIATTFNTRDFFSLWAVAEEALPDLSVGLQFGSQAIDRGLSVAPVVALHAPDFGQALATLARYKRLTCPEQIEVEVSGNEAAVRYRWLEAPGVVPRLLVDVTMASLNELARRGSGGRARPIRVELARRPKDRSLLRAHFGCPIVFEAEHDAMVFDAAALELPFVTADGGAFGDLTCGLEKRLADGEGLPGLIGAVRVAIARQLSEGRPSSVSAVAGRLALSGRTLQRRLGECGTSFQLELDGVRRTTASRLLSNTTLDDVAIALLLGFAEPNSFSRLFRAWERTTPSRWRKHHAVAA